MTTAALAPPLGLPDRILIERARDLSKVSATVRECQAHALRLFVSCNATSSESEQRDRGCSAIRARKQELPGILEIRERRNRWRCEMRDRAQFLASAANADRNSGRMQKDGGDSGSSGSGNAPWTARDSELLYRVAGWGAPYFFVSPEGHMCARLPGSSTDGPDDEIDLVELTESLKKRNVQLPLVIRFPNIVNHRIKQLQDCFASAIVNFNYKAHFQGVFPVKCNYDRFLLEEIVRFGGRYQFGLEAGSKPELLIAIAKLRRSRGALLICNGYKDKVYIESVLLARQLGLKAVVVLEQMEELELLIRCSKALGVKPLIGIRAKLSTRHSGHWGDTSGDDGKFGLTVNEIVRVVYTLRQENLLDSLQLLHFHLGSQISSISTIKEAMREGSHLYCELVLMGATMGYIDVGGGLGIDYDGTKRQYKTSMNYSIQNYANDVVAALVDACLLKGVAHPIITSESGRSLASHHSVLVLEVLTGRQPLERTALEDMDKLAKYSSWNLGTPDCRSARRRNEMDKGEYLLSTFFEVYQSISEISYWEAFNDAKQFKSEAGSLFKLGCLSLEQLAQANALYDAVCHRVYLYADPADAPQEVESLRNSLAAVYNVNLSIFRSVPDIWAISQVFPMVPLQRLQEKPTVEATLADLTCDSDGKIKDFVSASGDISHSLSVHELRSGEPYYIGLFLAGVYQEVMGSAHNLFGATNVVHVRAKACIRVEGTNGATKNGTPSTCNGLTYTVDHIIRGQTMGEMLKSMQHNAEDLNEELRIEAEEAVTDGRLSLEDAQILLRNFKSSLDSYTYLTR